MLILCEDKVVAQYQLPKKTEKSVRQAGRHPALVVRPFCEHHCVVIFDIWHYDMNHSLLVPVGDLGAAKELENY